MNTVLVHGCWDILTMGHLEHFERARKYGDRLVVSVSSDEIVSNKGPGRPIRPLAHRMRMLRALRMVDEVCVAQSPDASASIIRYCPTWFIQGIDYAESGPTDMEKWACKEVGAQIGHTTHPKADSTTAIIERIRCAS